VLQVGPTEGGGIATVLTNVVRALHPYPDLAVVPVASTAVSGRRAKLTAALRAWSTLRRAGRETPLVVHLHTASGVSFWRKSLLLRAARAAGARTVLHVHGGAFKEFAERARPRDWIAETLRLADHRIVVNEEQRDFLASRFQCAVELLPNAVAIPAPADLPTRPPFRWLHLARLGPAKGTWEFLEALHSLTALGDWEAVLAGDGEVEAVRRRASDLGSRVQVLGWQSSEAAAALLRASHALVLPSHLEGLPMSVLEAMALGRPVVTTPVGGLGTLVEDGVNGRLVPVGDVRSLAEALRAMMSDELEPMSKAARARVAERHDLSRVAARLHDLYIDLARSAPKVDR